MTRSTAEFISHHTTLNSMKELQHQINMSIHDIKTKAFQLGSYRWELVDTLKCFFSIILMNFIICYSLKTISDYTYFFSGNHLADLFSFSNFVTANKCKCPILRISSTFCTSETLMICMVREQNNKLCTSSFFLLRDFYIKQF